MPYASDAQRKYFNANRSKIGGKVVDEFNAASKGMKMPKDKDDKMKKMKKKMSRGAMKANLTARLASVMSKKSY